MKPLTITLEEFEQYRDSLPVKKRPSKVGSYKKFKHKKKILSPKELLADLIEQQRKDDTPYAREVHKKKWAV